jgi:hypothetical protein
MEYLLPSSKLLAEKIYNSCCVVHMGMEMRILLIKSGLSPRFNIIAPLDAFIRDFSAIIHH